MSESGWRRDVAVGVQAYAGSAAIVLLGLLFGGELVRIRGESPALPPPATSELLFRYDAVHYRDIATAGYAYDPATASNVAFFPLYPFLSRWLATGAGLPVEPVMTGLSQFATLTAFILLHHWMRLKGCRPGQCAAGVLAFALYPPGVFLRLPYSESLFACATLAALIGITTSRTWLAAIAAGVASATRPVGVVVSLAVVWWLGSNSFRTRRPSLVAGAGLAVLSTAGLLAYAAYLGWSFGSVSAFAQTQVHWRSHADAGGAEKLLALLTGEPIWNTYVPESARYWRSRELHPIALLSLPFMNPVYWLLMFGLIGFGAARRWLSVPEALLGLGLALLPYVTKGFDNSMLSFARFSAVVMPGFLVLGRLVAAGPAPAGGLLAAASGALLALTAALFAAGYAVF